MFEYLDQHFSFPFQTNEANVTNTSSTGTSAPPMDRSLMPTDMGESMLSVHLMLHFSLIGKFVKRKRTVGEIFHKKFTLFSAGWFSLCS